MLKRILFGGESGLSVQANVGLALLRIFAGIALMLAHGAGKVPPGGLVEKTAEMGFPVPVVFAWAAALSELVGGALLALGFCTRPAAFFIACTMLTALLGVHLHDPFGIQEKAFLYLFIAIAFLFTGSGDLSVDSLLRGRR